MLLLWLIEDIPLVASTDYPFLNKLFDHATHPLSTILQLEPEKLARSKIVHAPKVVVISPFSHKESTVVPVPSSMELLFKDVPPSSAVVTKQNEDWLSVMFDTMDEEMLDVASGEPTNVLM
nr:hypothetical protein [Tanacetum cinerariifolium]